MLQKMIKKMTGHLEVSACTVAEWERTILMAFPVWDMINQRRGGIVELGSSSCVISASTRAALPDASAVADHQIAEALLDYDRGSEIATLLLNDDA
jgi:hypothetical protein